MTQLETALIYAGMGWKLIPCNPMTKVGYTEHAYKDASDDEAQIREWWERWSNAAIGLAVPSNMAVVDVDSAEAITVLDHLPQDTVTSKTPRKGGGIHLFYVKPEEFKIGRKVHFLHGVDLLSEGGHVILPYSKHPTGGVYKWIKSPTKHQMAALPEWVMELVRKERDSPMDQTGDGVLQGRVNPAKILEGIPAGMRNNALYRFACWMRAHSVPYRLAILGIRDAAANCDPPYDEKDPDDFVERVYRKFPEGYSEDFRKSERKFWSAQDLIRAELQEPIWYVEKILPQGFCLFYAHPKTGKSIIAEGMARCIAAGEEVFSILATEPCDVLYMELELGEVMGKSRWLNIMGNKTIPNNLSIVFDWPRMDMGGHEQLKNYLEANPKTKVVFIDTLARYWPTKDLIDGNAYHKDYAVGEKISNLAKDFQVAIVCVYHKTKTEHGESIKNISGSMGLSASADILWDMRREESGMRSLEISGKMVENQTIELLPKGGSIFDWELDETA